MKYYALGDSQFVDMVEELKKAEEYIFMEFFIVSGGQMLGTILDILKEKARQGVEVRFMCDGTNVLWNLPSFFTEMMEEEGIPCKMFAPIRPGFSPHYNNRDHRKILVVDGKVAFTGGINLADEYINEKNRFGHWKDVGAMIRGDAVERFTYMFLEMWDESEEQPEDYERYRLPAGASVSNDGYVIPYSVCPLGSERVGEMVYLEIRRGSKYDGIIMDPPSYGRGPKGEIWKMEYNIWPFLQLATQLLSKDALFFLFNSYTTGLQPAVLSYMMNETLAKPLGGQVEASEIGLPVSQSGLVLPCGAAGRWQR